MTKHLNLGASVLRLVVIGGMIVGMFLMGNNIKMLHERVTEIENTAKTVAKEKTDRFNKLIKAARLDYCNKAGGYTYLFSDNCFVNNELKEIHFSHFSEFKLINF